MIDKDCISSLPSSTNVTLGPSPYPISGKTSLSQGYSEPICFKCEIQ